jgi:hypothetical protein
MPNIEAKLIEKYTSVLGNRCSIVTTGSAPVSPAVFEFLQKCFKLNVFDAYVRISSMK